MALFIHPENQKIIWETIHRHSSIDSIHPSVRTDWFKSVVKKMYEMIPKRWFHQKMTTEQLNTINQATIKYMINDLKPVILQQTPQYTQQQSQQQFPQNNNSVFSENKSQSTNMIQERFIEKQKEMESLLNTKAPSQINFKIDEIDEPISNMEELLKQQMSQRELDIQQIPDISTSLSRSDVSSPKSSVRDVRNVHAPFINISETEVKHVSFDNRGLLSDSDEIQQLKTHIQTIQTDVSQLKIMMQEFMDVVSTHIPAREATLFSLQKDVVVQMNMEKISKTIHDHEKIIEIFEPEQESEIASEPELSNLSNAESET